VPQPPRHLKHDCTPVAIPLEDFALSIGESYHKGIVVEVRPSDIICTRKFLEQIVEFDNCPLKASYWQGAFELKQRTT